jgi:S1-C subfamily serine protease
MIRLSPRQPLLAFAIGAFALSPMHAARAQEPSLLQQLSNDTQHVYEQVRGGMVRIALPTPQWLEQVNEQEKLLRKWGNQLNPDALNALRHEQQRMMDEHFRQIGAVVPATQSSTPSPSTQASVAPTTTPGVMFPPRPADPGNLVLVATGLLIDNDGHVAIPMYVDRQVIGTAPLRVAMGDGQVTTATFIGSDAKTRLTVLQLQNHAGKPVTLAPHRPDDGTLTLAVDRLGSARLVVWTNDRPEPGVIVLPDGSVAGFGLNGRFLAANDAKPILDQIIATGSVRRAVLGVGVQEVGKDAPIRQQIPALGEKAAFFVQAVDPNSAAQRGGMQVGDLITAIAGQPVGDAPTFAAVIAMRSGKTTFTVIRNGESLDLSIDLQPQ